MAYRRTIYALNSQSYIMRSPLLLQSHWLKELKHRVDHRLSICGSKVLLGPYISFLFHIKLVLVLESLGLGPGFSSPLLYSLDLFHPANGHDGGTPGLLVGLETLHTGGRRLLSLGHTGLPRVRPLGVGLPEGVPCQDVHDAVPLKLDWKDAAR